MISEEGRRHYNGNTHNDEGSVRRVWMVNGQSRVQGAPLPAAPSAREATSRKARARAGAALRKAARRWWETCRSWCRRPLSDFGLKFINKSPKAWPVHGNAKEGHNRPRHHQPRKQSRLHQSRNQPRHQPRLPPQ